MTSAEQDIESICTSWHRAIETLDFVAAEALWDGESDGALLYQPEEFEQPMTTVAELEDYWAKVPGHVEAVPEWRPVESKVQVIDSAGMVWQKLETKIKLRGVEPTFDGIVRCSLGLRDTPEGWRLVHYHESRLVSVEHAIESLQA
jgi:ketosteroid isomerase-like protein